MELLQIQVKINQKRLSSYKDFEDKYNLYKEEEIQSQLRLYYVAFTRAKIIFMSLNQKHSIIQGEKNLI